MTTAVELTPGQKVDALPPPQKLALAADLADKGHGLAAIVIARAAISEMTAKLVTR